MCGSAGSCTRFLPAGAISARLRLSSPNGWGVAYTSLLLFFYDVVRLWRYDHTILRRCSGRSAPEHQTLYPPVRPNLVPRPRLTERLNAGLHRKLTLISAPAGFGKTTLLSEWVAGCDRPVAWLSALLATVGLALLSMPLGQSLVVGDGLVLGCALMFAIHILLVGRYASRYDPLALSAVQMGVVALLSGLVAPWAEPWPARLSPVVWGAVLFTALLATVLALVLQVSAQRRTPPHRAALLLTLEPVFAALAAYFLGERLTPQGWMGCALILIAMVMAEVAERNN